jgi:hypothetical protein
MALSNESTKKVQNGLAKIFTKIPTTAGDKQDGGAEQVSVSVLSISKDQLQQLSELSKDVPNSMLIDRSGAKVRVTFY